MQIESAPQSPPRPTVPAVGRAGFTKARPYGPAALQTAANKGADIFSCDHRVLSKPLVQQAHALGLEVYVWTVNEKSDIARMAEWDVDAITTDYPDRCRAVFCGSRNETTIR